MPKNREESGGHFPSLKEFLVLTESEQILLDYILQAIGVASVSNDWKSVHDVIIQESPFAIIKCAEQSEKIQALCNGPALQSYWQAEWVSIINPDNGYQMQPQPVVNYFDLYRGYYFYLLAVDAFTAGHGPQDPVVMDYLLKAQIYDSFHAVFQLNGYLLCTLQETVTRDVSLNFSSELAALQHLADIYLTPGYLLLARSHFEFAQYEKRFAGNSNTTKSIEYYTQALRYLLIAEQLAPYSQASIGNACEGRNLADFFRVPGHSWDDIKDMIIQQAGSSLSSSVVKSIYNDADTVIESNLKRLQLNHALQSQMIN